MTTHVWVSGSTQSARLTNIAYRRSWIQIEEIGEPATNAYKSWEQFDEHLDSMETCAAKLKALGY